MLRILIFVLMLVMIVCNWSFADCSDPVVCTEELKLKTIDLSVDISKCWKMPHGFPCRALAFGKMLDKNGGFIWWFLEEKNTIVLGKDKPPVPVKLYWIIFKKGDNH